MATQAVDTSMHIRPERADDIGEVRTAVAHWERTLQTIFELADGENGKSYRDKE